MTSQEDITSQENVTFEDELLVIRSLQIAYEYHEGQVDKAGLPYIEHCIRVGILAGEHATSMKERLHLAAIGFLHDILEDTELTEEALLVLIKNQRVVDVVVQLTRIKGETYYNYIEQVSNHRWATLVKLADTKDHLTKREEFVLPESLRIRYEMAQQQLLKTLSN